MVGSKKDEMCRPDLEDEYKQMSTVSGTEQTGVTIYKYLQNRRLTIAAEKLVKTNKPITQITYEAGYDTQQSFSFAFKQVYLYPPKTYRDIGIYRP